MQLGFVIDHTRCIGCHACTVACKAENDVPLGNFRTWVKYTEEGEFPQVKRSFGVLRCNQCSDAPCVTICPVRALEKRADGIVDVDPEACIGCKSCMQGCPYDALYLNEATGTAEKCHFCAHRTEIGLAPACAVVCPTEAIIPGDFHDPQSAVSRLTAAGGLTVRKSEAGTGPNVRYREAAAAALDPGLTDGARGYLWADRLPSVQLQASEFQAMEERAQAHTVYDVAHPSLWGGKVSAYLFTKSLSAGAVLAPAVWLPDLIDGGLTRRSMAFLPALALLFLMVTTVLLVGDLKRPERFLFILTRPNWSSWLVRGSVILMLYGLVLSGWLALGLLQVALPAWASWSLYGAGALLAALTAAYTAWLFRQARGRPLWMRRSLGLHLLAQALTAGCALLLLLHGLLAIDARATGQLRWGLLGALAAHLLLTLAEGSLAPAGREKEFRRTARLITHGPFARDHWRFGVGIGIGLPVLLLLAPDKPWLWAAAALPALAGLIVEEDILVRAGQAMPIS